MPEKSGQVILQKVIQRFFIINIDAFLQCLPVRMGKVFRPIGENFGRFCCTDMPEGDFSIADSKKKAQNQCC